MNWLDTFLAAANAWDATLEALCASASPTDASALRLERAAILEHEAGFSRDEAERRAGVA